MVKTLKNFKLMESCSFNQITDGKLYRHQIADMRWMVEELSLTFRIRYVQFIMKQQRISKEILFKEPSKSLSDQMVSCEILKKSERYVKNLSTNQPSNLQREVLSLGIKCSVSEVKQRSYEIDAEFENLANKVNGFSQPSLYT